jgi:hypothetical protein
VPLATANERGERARKTEDEWVIDVPIKNVHPTLNPHKFIPLSK